MNTIYISSQKKGFKHFIKSIFKNLNNAIVVTELPHNYTVNHGKRRSEVKLDLGNIPLRDLNVENNVCAININHNEGFPIAQVPLNDIGEVENFDYRIENQKLILSLVHPVKKESWWTRFKNKIEGIKNFFRVISSLTKVYRQKI